MDTKEFIQRRHQDNKRDRLQFRILDDDAIILNGKYSNMMLSDIFIIYPAFVDWLIGDSRTDPGLRMVARSIKSDADVFAKNIEREISTCVR